MFVMYSFMTYITLEPLESGDTAMFQTLPMAKNIVLLTGHYRKTLLDFYPQNFVPSVILLLWNLLHNSHLATTLCSNI